MSQSLQEIAAEHRRLAILQILNAPHSDYRMGDERMADALELLGQGASRAVVKGDFAWLERQSLIAVQELPGCHIAVLRQEGVDVATGKSVVPGIHRPAPGL